MLHDFAILHRRKPRVIDPAVGPVWSTCLRTLAFVTPDHPVGPGDEFYVGARAYEFLLETVCGLHSPILGETEVMGQFKQFAVAWVEREPRRQTLVQRVLADAKALRAQYLVNLGTQSYGSWLRRHLDADRVHVIGAGHLAQEITPHLAKEAAVTWHARRPVAAVVPVELLGARAFDRGSLIIAAPVSATEVAAWLGERTPDQIFDLRDDSATDRVPGAIPLTTVFADIERTRARLAPRLESIRREIAARGARLAGSEKVRPQGWDDLCA